MSSGEKAQFCQMLSSLSSPSSIPEPSHTKRRLSLLLPLPRAHPSLQQQFPHMLLFACALSPRSASLFQFLLRGFIVKVPRFPCTLTTPVMHHLLFCESRLRMAVVLDTSI